jgi:hypothetical protein
MDLLDFFNMNKKFERMMIPGSETQGHLPTVSEELFHNPFNIKEPVKGQDYTREYQEQEEHEMVEVSIIWYCS